MKQTDEKQSKSLRFRTVRNVFLVYLFTAAATDRYEIFAAICASYPFIMPLLFADTQTDTAKMALKSVLYGLSGCTAAVVFLLVTHSFKSRFILVPGMFSLLASAGYLMLYKKLSAQKKTVMKCIITVFVCLLAFV